MTYNPNAGRGGHHQQPPFEIVLDDSYSIVCDDVPVNCTIRVMPVDGRSPPRLSPVSQTRWIEDRPRPDPGSSRGDYNWIPFQRDKCCKLVGSPIASPPSHWRSRRSIVDSIMRNIEENNAGATSRGIHKGEAGDEDDVFPPRKHCEHQFSDSPSPTPSFESSDSYSSSSHQPSPPQSAHSTITDRLLNLNRQQPNFRRTNINVDGTDLREMHSDLGPRGAQTSSPAVQSSKAMEERPQWASPSPPASPSSRPSPPSAVRGGRCCAMAEYDQSNYRSNTPERDSGGTDSSASGGVTAGGPCTYHGSQPCPVRSGSYCKANRAGRGSGSPSPPPPHLRGARSCKYHDSLPCPALAGVPCRGEIQKSGSNRSLSPDPGSRSPPRSPSPDKRAQNLPESNSLRPRSTSRSGGVAAPRTISPPPKSPRSRSPPSRRAQQKNKGEIRLNVQNSSLAFRNQHTIG